MYLEQCTEDQVKKVYEEFNVTEETLQRDVKTLVEWLEKQPHLPNVKDENLLRLFLLRRKTSLERTKKTLEMYFIYKAQLAQVFINRDPNSTQFKKSYDLTPCFFLPKLTPDLNRVLVVRCNSVPSNAAPNAEEYLQFAMTIISLNSLTSGVYKKTIVVIDCKNLSASMLPIFMPNLTKSISMITDLAPIRVETIYFLNFSAILEPALALARKISKKLFQDRLIIWKKDEKLLTEVIPENVLPLEYGGTSGSVDELSALYFKELLSWKSWLDEENKHVADLNRLPEDKKTALNMGEFGMEGSFRKLDLD